MLSCLLLALALLPQSSPSQAEKDEARRLGEEQSRQQRERETSRIHQPDHLGTRRMATIQGRVWMDGGGPPPDRVTVALVCNNAAVAQTFTDDKGRYIITPGSNNNPAPDAAIRAAGGPSVSAGCAVTASLPGFRSAPVILEGPVKTDLILKPIENVTGYTFSATSAYAPKEARELFKKAASAVSEKKHGDAEKHLRRALELHPKYAAAWYELGKLLLGTGNATEARKALESSAAADPKYINPHPLLIQMAINERRWEDVARHTGAVISMNPVFSADMYLFSAQAHLLLGNLDLAEKHANEAIAMDTLGKLPVARQLLERIHAKKAG